MQITKESEANTVAVVERVINQIEELKSDPDMQGVNIYYME